jgi:CheY-like chemotaxis protein
MARDMHVPDNERQVRMRILLVDDDRGLGEMLSRQLRSLGHHALFVLGPLAALDLLRTHVGEFECVITDICMPHLDGVALANAIHARWRELPVGFCTGSDPRDPRVVAARAIGPVVDKLCAFEELPALLDALSRGSVRPKLALRRHRL